jgi:sugar fermentation stimulation protein A
VEEARFVARPNRFLVLAERIHPTQGRTGEVVRVHCPDPGRLRELLLPDAKLYISPSQSRALSRRTQYDLRFVLHHPEAISPSAEPVLVSLDSRLPNRLVGLALAENSIRLAPGPQVVKAEVVGPVANSTVHSRFDFRVGGEDGSDWWVEVKSATLVEKGIARFPDAPTTRGVRHLVELTQIVRQGIGRAAVLFIVQRADAVSLEAHAERDPAFARALAEAYGAGVAIRAFTCTLSTTSIALGREIPVRT